MSDSQREAPTSAEGRPRPKVRRGPLNPKTEGAKALKAWQVYRDMGPDRSIAAVAEQLGKSKTMIARWATAHGWGERLVQIERERDAAARKADEKAIAKKAVERVAAWTARMEEWLEDRVKHADLLARQGRYLASFPAMTETTTGGGAAASVTYTAAPPGTIMAGAKLLAMADEMRAGAYREAIHTFGPTTGPADADRDAAPPPARLTSVVVRLTPKRPPEGEE